MPPRRTPAADLDALCAELSAAGRAVEAPEAAARRLRRRVQMAIKSPVAGAGWRWQMAVAFAAGVVCMVPFVHRATPPPMQTVLAVPPAADPPLTLLACEQAAAHSDAALARVLSRDATRPLATLDVQPLRAFSPTTLATLAADNRFP